MTRWALLVIDLQKDLCWSDRRAKVVTETLPTILTLIDAFIHSGSPVIYSRFELDRDDPQFARFGDQYCIRGTPGVDFIDEIKPLKGRIVPKTKHSAFFGTDLEEIMVEGSVTGVVLTGIQTQICVLTTAADAYHRGFEVVVAKDAVISTRDDVRLQAVEWIDRYVGRAMRTEDIVRLL